MHWTTHIITGAATGYLIGRPLPAALVGFASHLALDIAPHYDPDSEIGYVVDSLVGCAALAFIATNRDMRRADVNGAALWGAVGGALPDLELLVNLFKDIDTEEYILPWHNGTLTHRQTHIPGSTASQVALIVVLLWLVAAKARKLGLRRAGAPAGRAG